jgi:hypothetical protein
MENICRVRQQLFEICRMRHELIEIEEYTPRVVNIDRMFSTFLGDFLATF